MSLKTSFLLLKERNKRTENDAKQVPKKKNYIGTEK